ncbi:stalk domain-containing protein [Crassaminicella profunda]|uniref:stalk domain-containing protein n=1 Tax=Crassaminicella profunda TaxID=1286698 RepID=UPI001CA77B86|nr:stalk domain-containing protein [Crassaminicella profunda]QZY55653.1 copper amine oxidase N-terminal domain-containing protein [Crassaminicella profunda]
MKYRVEKGFIVFLIMCMLCGSWSFASSDNHVTRIPHVKDDWSFKDSYAPILVIEEKSPNEFGGEDQQFELTLENAEWFEEDDDISVADMVYDGVHMSSRGVTMNIRRFSSKEVGVTINRGTYPTNKKAVFKIPLYSKVNHAGDVTVTIDSDTAVSGGTYKYALAIGKVSGNGPTVSIGHIFGKDHPVWITIKEPLGKKFGQKNQTFILTLSNSKWANDVQLNLEESIKNTIIKNVSDAKIVSIEKLNDQKAALTINRGKKDLDRPVYFYIPLYIQVTHSGNISLDIKSKEDIDFFKDVSLELEVEEYKNPSKILYFIDDEGAVDIYNKRKIDTTVYIYINSLNINIDQSGIEEKIKLDVAPIIEKGRTLIPLRGVLEALGVQTTWQKDIRGVLLASNDQTIQLYVDSKKAYINSQPVEMPIAPKIINNRVFVPLRFISESFDYDVNWIQEEQKIMIKK